MLDTIQTQPAPAIIHTPREQWLLARAERVTSTDAADLICHALGDDSAYRAPAEILAAKWGLTDDIEASEPMKWGNRLEAVVAKHQARGSGHCPRRHRVGGVAGVGNHPQAVDHGVGHRRGQVFVAKAVSADVLDDRALHDAGAAVLV